MASKGSYLISAEGILKIVTIVLGIITIGCGIPSYDKDISEERYFYGASLACLIASMAFFPIFFISSALDGNSKLKIIDFLYHIVLGIILIVSSSMMLKSAVDENKGVYGSAHKTPGQRNYDKKVVAGAFGLLNSIVYMVASVVALRSKNDDEMSFSKRYGPAT